MGNIYEFKCPKCHYAVEVSGGDDCGMVSATTTILCKECKKLYDVMIGSAPLNENSYSTPICPEKRGHTVRRWTYPDVCPKCGAMIKKGELVLLWD